MNKLHKYIYAQKGVDAKDALGRTYSKNDDGTYLNNSNNKNYSYDKTSKKFIPISEKGIVDKYITPIADKVLSTLGVNYGKTSDDPIMIDLNSNVKVSLDDNPVQGNIIMGGEFIEDGGSSIRTKKEWYKNKDGVFGDKKIPVKNIKNYYGVEDDKFIVGGMDKFKDETIIIPVRSKDIPIHKTDFKKSGIFNETTILKLKDSLGRLIPHNIQRGGKAILYSETTGNKVFINADTPENSKKLIDDFIKKNPKTKYIMLDNGRFRNHLQNKEGLNPNDFLQYGTHTFGNNKTYNLVKYQTGGNPDNLTIVEDGEYIRDNQGKIGKITNIPSHDDNELIIDGESIKVPKGKAGQGIYNVKSVLSATHENRNQSDDTYTQADEEIKIKPQEALLLADQLNLNIKRPLGSISPSKLMDKLLESRENLVSKYKNINKDIKSDRQANSFTANVDVLSSIPTPEDIYEFLFTNQENSKSEQNEMYAKTGIYINPEKKGTFKAAASRYGMSMDALAEDAKENPEKYSGILRKKANFYRNFAKQIGGYSDIELEDEMYQTGGLKKPQQDLKNWTNQKWRTNSGEKSSETGERYLPDKAWDNLSSSEKARTNRAKREGGGTGENVPQPKDIADKVSKYRKAQYGIENEIYFKEGGSTVNAAGNYTKPEMRKRLFNRIKNEASMGTEAGKWSARKAQKLARLYKENGGGYKQIGGRLQTFPTMDGSKPVALVNTSQGVKKVSMIDNRTVSMDDMYDKDSVQIQGNKAVIVKKNPLKKFIK